MKIKASSPHILDVPPYKVTLQCIKGDSVLVDKLVCWAKSPQGWDYWRDIHRGKREMSFDDKVFLICLSYSYIIQKYRFEVVVSDEALKHIERLTR